MATKYKCPYCDARGLTKEDLAGHIDDQHREMIPEGWSAGRLAFKIIYKKDHGTCVVCKKDTQWNEKRCKYQRLCGDPKCKKTLRDAALKNHIKVYKCSFNRVKRWKRAIYVERICNIDYRCRWIKGIRI